MSLIAIHGKLNSGKDTVTTIIDSIDHGLQNKTIIRLVEKNFHSHYQYDRKRFADKLKDIVCLLIGCTRDELEDRDFKETELGEEWIRYGYANGFFHINGSPIMNNEACSKEKYEEQARINWQTAYKGTYTPRRLLQYIGTDLFRKQLHHDVWVNSLFADYKKKFTGLDAADHFVKNDGTSMESQYPKWIITDLRFPNEFKGIKDREGLCFKVIRPKRSCVCVDDAKLDCLVDCDGKSKSEHESETSLDHIPDSDWDEIIINDGSIEDLIDKVRVIMKKRNLI